MKLSISLPKHMAQEIRKLAKESNRSISWWIQKSWLTARTQLRNPQAEEKAAQAALAKLSSLRGALKDSYPSKSSVDLAHSAFDRKRTR